MSMLSAVAPFATGLAPFSWADSASMKFCQAAGPETACTPRQTIVGLTCHSNHQAMPCKLAPAKVARLRTSESGRNATTCGANCSRFCDSTSARLRSLRLAHCRLEEDARNPATLQSQGRKHNTKDGTQEVHAQRT